MKIILFVTFCVSFILLLKNRLTTSRTDIKVTLLMQSTSAMPQTISQAFSTSNIITPTGEVIQQSVYIDSDGNRIINGEKLPVEQPMTENKMQALTRPDWNTSIR